MEKRENKFVETVIFSENAPVRKPLYYKEKESGKTTTVPAGIFEIVFVQ